MSWMFDPDYFRISKSEGIWDIDQFIAAIMGVVNPTLADWQYALHDKQHNFDDFEGQQVNPYEAEAIEMAIRSGQLPAEIGEIVHGGSETPGYNEARMEALRVGKPLVNRAATRQNEMNEGVFNTAPLPFVENGQDPAMWTINAAYLNGASATVQEQKEGPQGRRQGAAAFNPWKNDQLVTNIISGRNMKPEGFARWYEPAAKEMGLVEQRYNKSGSPVGGGRFLIPAHYVHTNAISVNDQQLLKRIAGHITQLRDQGMGHDQIKADLIEQPFMYNSIHHANHGFDGLHGRIERKEQENQEIRDGLAAPAEDDDLDAQLIPQPAQSVDDSILHPDSLNEPWVRYLGQSSQHPDKTKTAVKGLMKHFDMQEEDALNLLNRAYNREFPGRTGKQRILHGLYEHEMDKWGGKLPGDHWYQGPQPPVGGRGIGDEQPPAPDVAGQPPRPPGPNIPPNIPVVPPAPPPIMGDQVVATPPALGNRAPLPPNIAQAASDRFIPETSRDLADIHRRRADIPLSESDSIGPAVGERKLSRFAELLGRASLSDIFRRSDEFKSEIEEYIEDVQIEMAKAVISDYHDIRKMDIENPLDIAIISSRIQRPSNDVITIYHTRGDWRNIAKSFRLPHEDVQLVKVALHG